MFLLTVWTLPVVRFGRQGMFMLLERPMNVMRVVAPLLSLMVSPNRTWVSPGQQLPAMAPSVRNVRTLKPPVFPVPSRENVLKSRLAATLHPELLGPLTTLPVSRNRLLGPKW